MSRLKIVWMLFVLLGILPAGLHAADAARGRVTGGQYYDLPNWFKASFLYLREDAQEAKQRGRHLMLFMHLDECPYCARLLQENFRSGPTREFAEKHFDVIGINIRGDKAVEWFDGKGYSERELARKLKVVATPTLVFFDPDGNVVLQLNGYRTPASLRQALEYVQGKHYRTQTLAEYVQRQKLRPVYEMRPDPRFVRMTNFKGYAKPLMILFEDKDCADCAEFHAKVLDHPEVRAELAKYKIVRLDAYSTQPIVDVDGHKTTPKAWAKELHLVYRPGVLFINEGEVRQRMDGMQWHFHFKELARYVSGKYYDQYDTFSAYNAARREEILSQGGVIDFAQ